MSDDFLGNAFESLGDSVLKPAAKAVADQTQVSKTPQNIAGQITGQQVDTSDQQQKDVNDFNKALYGKSDDPKQATPQSQDPSHTSPQAKEEAEKKKLAEARERLQFHMEHYYKPTFETKKKTDESAQERNEREEDEKKKKEQMELQEEEKKKPIKPPITKGSGEKKLGIGG